MSKFKKQTALCVTLITSLGILSACSGGSGSGNARVFAGETTVSSTGRANVVLDSQLDGSVTVAGVGLVAYATGAEQFDNRISAVAGIQNGATVGSAETSGTGSYSSRYQYVVADEIATGGGSITAFQYESDEATITLNADFDAGTLTGNTSDLDVDGRIRGTNLSGTAVVDYFALGGSTGILAGSVTTTLDGNVGSTGVIGIFTGTDSDTTIAGGIVGTRN